MSVLASLGEDMHLTAVVSDGNTGLYPRALIYDKAGNATPLAILDLDHVAEGYYRAAVAFNVSTSEKFTVVFIFFEDAARTIESPSYDRTEQTIVSDFVPQGLVGSSS